MSVRLRAVLIAAIVIFAAIAIVGTLTDASWKSAAIWTSTVVLVVCMGVLFVSMFRHRQAHR